MKEPNRIRQRLCAARLVVLIGAISGCTSTGSAPVRDGSALTPANLSSVPVQAGERASTHVVRPGDTLNVLARQYGQSVASLVAWNNLSDRNQIHVGQTLLVSPPAAGGGDGASVMPVPAEAGAGPVASEGAVVVLKRSPLGGRKPYSDEAWARSGASAPEPLPAAPAAASVPAARPQGEGGWQWPVKGKPVAPFSETGSKGIDIPGTAGEPVFASAAGKVVYAGSGLRGYGKLIIIKHESEHVSVYAHNQKLLVNEADVVNKGQQIAELGNTESDRPKLHFEIRKQGKAVDPLKYLPPR